MNQRKRVRRDVEQFLRQLGEDARGVTEHLRLLGVRGRPRDFRECAIARYHSLVTSTDARVRSVLVRRDDARVRLSRPVWLPITNPLTRALRDFILVFEASILPDIEDQRDCERDSDAASGVARLA
jgi:hypothetical protein